MRKRFTLGSLREWHWISSALCLAGLLLFAVTGITLNHAAQIEGRSAITTVETQLPEELLVMAREASIGEVGLPQRLQDYLEQQIDTSLYGRAPEWNPGELYIGMPRPGADTWLSLDLETGDLLFEDTDRGWIAYFNDLHKGRHTGLAWSWFIDVFAAVCVLFSLTGLLLLRRQVASRPTTWPLTGLGLLIPLLLMFLLIH